MVVWGDADFGAYHFTIRTMGTYYGPLGLECFGTDCIDHPPSKKSYLNPPPTQAKEGRWPNAGPTLFTNKHA